MFAHQQANITNNYQKPRAALTTTASHRRESSCCKSRLSMSHYKKLWKKKKIKVLVIRVFHRQDGQIELLLYIGQHDRKPKQITVLFQSLAFKIISARRSWVDSTHRLRQSIEGSVHQAYTIRSSIAQNRVPDGDVIGDVWSVMPQSEPLYKTVHAGPGPSSATLRSLAQRDCQTRTSEEVLWLSIVQAGPGPSSATLRSLAQRDCQTGTSEEVLWLSMDTMAMSASL